MSAAIILAVYFGAHLMACVKGKVQNRTKEVSKSAEEKKD